MLTPDDGSTDGRTKHHINKPEKFQSLDPELYDKLIDINKGREHLKIGYLDAIGLIPNARYFDKLVPMPADGSREAYWQQAQSVINGSGLIFLDPDNGMEIPSTSKNSIRSVRYVYFDEITRLLDQAPVLIYQHFPRVKRDVYIPNRINQLKMICGATSVRVIQTGQVGFFLVDRKKSEHLNLAFTQLGKSLEKLNVKVW